MEAEEEKQLSLYPMYYGVSCAFVALQLLAEKKGLLVDGKWSAMAETLLQGSAKLLGLLVWKAQGGDATKASSLLTNKLEKTEQSWVCERKKLRMQIQALENELRLVDAKHKHLVASLRQKIREKDQLRESKAKDFKKVEEELQLAVMTMEEMRKSMTKESSDVWKQKASFIHEFQASKQQLLEVMERKAESEEMVKELTSELAKLQKDAQQKDRILSAMFRKSKLDVSQKLFLRETDNSMEISGSNFYDSRLNHGRGLIAKSHVLGSLELECGREYGGNMVKRVDHRSMDICSGHSARDNGDIGMVLNLSTLISVYYSYCRQIMEFFFFPSRQIIELIFDYS